MGAQPTLVTLGCAKNCYLSLIDREYKSVLRLFINLQVYLFLGLQMYKETQII